ncbi:unnamed protein product [Closterium sp. NIES-53]
MYALSVSAEGDCYRCVPPDPGIAAAALGASESGTLPGTAPAHALHTFTLDSGASACFFRDSTTLTPLSTPVPVRLADPSGGPAVARSSTVLPCPAVPSGSLSCLHLPSFSANLVSTAALQDAMVTTTTPGGQRVTICTCTRTGRHLATFTRRPGSSLYTLATEPPQTLLWHHRLGHPSLPRLRGMHSRLLVSGLPRSLPPLPPSPAPPCLPCIEGRQRAAPHSSSFPSTTAPLHTLLMDIGGEFSSSLLRDFCRGECILQSFTLPDSPQKNGIAERRIGLVMEVAHTSMIHAAAPHFLWPFAVRYAAHQLNLWPRVSLRETSPTLCWTGKVGNASVFRVWGSRAFVCDTSADKLSTRAIPCVFLGFVPDALGWPFYHPTSRRLLPSHDVTFDESVPFCRLFPYRSAPPPPPPLFLAPGPPPVAVGSGAAPGATSGGAASGGVEPGGAGSEGAGSGGAEPGGAEPEGVEPGGAELEGAESGGAEPRGAASSGGPAGASPRLSSQQLREWLVQRAHRRRGAPGAGGVGDTGAGGATVPAGAGGTGGTAATEPGGSRTSGVGAAGTGGVGCAGAGDPTEPGAAGARARGAGVGGPSAGGARASRAGVGGTGAGGARPQVLGVLSSTGLPPPFLCPPPDQSQPPLQPASPLPAPSFYTEQSDGLTERREPASHPISPVRIARRAPRSRPPPVPGTHAMSLHPSSVPLRVPLPAPPESSLPEVPDPASDRACAASPTVSRLLATAVTEPSFESAAASALVAELLDFAAACRLDYAAALVAESMSSSPPSVAGECALGTDVLEDRQEDFECLAAAIPRFASMLLAPEGDPDAPDIPTPRSYAEAITGPYSSQWQAAMDAEMASWKSTGTYVDEVPLSRANIVDGMWIFRMKRPPGSPPAFKRDYELHSLDFNTAFLQGSLHEEIWLRRPPGFTGTFPAGTQWSLRRPVYGLRQVPREWHDTLRITLAALGFAPSTADLSLFLCTDTSLPPFYVLVYVLQRFGFQFSSPQPTPLSTSHSLSAPPLDESIEPSGSYPGLVGCLMYLMMCTRPDLAYPLSLLARYVVPGRHRKVHWDAAKRVLRYLCNTSGMGLVLGGRGPVVLTGHADASWVDDSATQQSSQGYIFSLGSGSVSWRSTRSSSVLSSSCEAEIYAGAMAAQELRWLTYLLTDLGEQPRSPPQRGQFCLAYVATRANNADVFTKALPPSCFAFLTGLVTTCSPPLCLWGLLCFLDWSCDHLFSPTLPMGRGQLRLAYVATRANTADVFTKDLGSSDH